MPTIALSPVAEDDGDHPQQVLHLATEAVIAAGNTLVLADAGFEVGRRVQVTATHEAVAAVGDPLLTAQLDPFLGAEGVIFEVIACPIDLNRLPPLGNGNGAFLLDTNGKPLCWLQLLFQEVAVDGVPQFLIEVVDEAPTPQGLSAVEQFSQRNHARRTQREALPVAQRETLPVAQRETLRVAQRVAHWLAHWLAQRLRTGVKGGGQ